MNPTDIIDRQKKEFTQNYKNNVYKYTLDGRSMHAAWSGHENLRPLILIHGSPGSYDSWSEYLLSSQLQSKFHIIAVDRPGYGLSGSGQAEHSLQKQASAIWALLQFNKSGLPAILVGHSYGGPVIARMAIDQPQQTAGLIFVAGSLDPELEDFKWYQNLAVWRITRWMLPTDLVVCNDEIMPLKSELELLMPLWEKIKAPSVIIQGDQDDLVPKENRDFLLKYLSQSKILSSEVTLGMNHFVPWKRQDLIYTAIEKIHLHLEPK